VSAGRSHLRGDGTRKMAYPMLEDASPVASARTVPGRVLYVAYPCPHCPAFHVGRPGADPPMQATPSGSNSVSGWYGTCDGRTPDRSPACLGNAIAADQPLVSCPRRRPRHGEDVPRLG